MNARTQAIVWDFGIWFAIGFVIAVVPILERTIEAGPDAFSWRPFLWAILGAAVAGLAGAVRKFLAPQLVSVGEPTEPGGKPTIVGVALKDVNPAPPVVNQVQQTPPTQRVLDTIDPPPKITIPPEDRRREPL